MNIPQASPNEWVIFNVKQTGMYLAVIIFEILLLNSIKVEKQNKVDSVFGVEK